MKKVKEFAKRSVAAASAAVIVFSYAAVTAFAGEQLGQTDFDEGVGLPWHICESGPGKMEFDISDGVYKITIVNPGGASRGGEDRWDCQFRHRGLKIVAGHEYEVNYEITPSNSGKYYTKIGNLEGDVEIWHNMATNEGDLGSTWDPIPIEANETKKVNLTFTAGQSLDVAEWAFHLGGDGQYTNGDCFPEGTVITFDNMSLKDLTSDENDHVAAETWKRADILTNQVGYFKGRAKRATMLCTDEKPIGFKVKDESGKEVFSGKSEYFGFDKDSGDTVHVLDLSKLDDEGTFTIEADNGSVSREFRIGAGTQYSAMLYDSLNYFYQNRSGIEIVSDFITSGDKDELARAAGHTTDMAEVEQTWGYSASSGSYDVTGGWYDAGDHGKYVVNGGLSLWMLQNQYESALKFGFADAYADGTMNLPENNNGYPDLLDEARWEMEWMLKMQVEDGECEGMAYHKAHDEKWTALGTAPADDEEKRIIKPPTTAATLNLAACGAQSARLWKELDPEFASKCLETAKKAYEAAKEHPDMYAPLDESVGGGAYGDDNVQDEFYWAASELWITTGDKDYYKDAEKSKFFLAVPTMLGSGESVDSVGSFDWGNTAALGTFSALLNEKAYDGGDIGKAKDELTKAADSYLAVESKQGYGLPYGQSTISYNDSDTGYLWGSNSFVADNAVVLAYAYLVTEKGEYMDGALGGLDYLLGRNPMDYSYVTGYGTHSIENPHHRWWSNQIDETFPKAPCGVMSGGPNSGMQDPWVRGSGWKKGEIAPQKCYLDHIEAWSVNECTINWNASLAWLVGFSAAENGGIEVGSVNIAERSNDGGSGEANNDTKYDEEKAERNEKNMADDTPKDKTDKDSKARHGSLSGGVLAVIVIACAVMIGAVVVFVSELRKGSNTNHQ